MKPVLLLGGGGHAIVVLDTLLASQQHVAGFLDLNPEIDSIFGLKRLGSLDKHSPKHLSPEEVVVANGLGSMGNPSLRESIFNTWKQHGFQFVRVRHPNSVVGRDVELGEGVQVMAGSVIQPGVVVGENTIINTRTSIDHHCVIGAHVHIAPGATLSGAVSVGDRAHVGAGVVIIQGINVGTGSMVGAGSVVVKDVPPEVTVMGVPARQING